VADWALKQTKKTIRHFVNQIADVRHSKIKIIKLPNVKKLKSASMLRKRLVYLYRSIFGSRTL
jgi:hypothetical protein